MQFPTSKLLETLNAITLYMSKCPLTRWHFSHKSKRSTYQSWSTITNSTGRHAGSHNWWWKWCWTGKFTEEEGNQILIQRIRNYFPSLWWHNFTDTLQCLFPPHPKNPLQQFRIERFILGNTSRHYPFALSVRSQSMAAFS